MPAPFPLQPDPVPTSSSVGQSVASVGSIASSKITEGPIRKLVNRNIEKRVTRSSLGGQTSREGSALGSDGPSPPSYLPESTPILLTLVTPKGLTHHPPLLLPNDVPPSPEKKTLTQTDEPDFRLLTPGDAFSRSRHAGSEEIDTSDAFYHRLHRYPEVLEKRSARLERERLIHERSKLILELEELRGRGWVYHGSQGGKGEEERRRKIREGEERLKRYDALLPNQPRKSNFLTGIVSNDPPSRSHSPAPGSLSGRASSLQHRYRQDSPVSASGDGGTTIRIKFTTGGGHSTARPVPSRGGGKGKLVRPTSMISYRRDEESSSSESDYDHVRGTNGRTRRKRDRKSEIARAAERIKLGLPPRAKLPGDPKRERRQSLPDGGGRRRSRRYDDEDEDEEDDPDGHDTDNTLRAGISAVKLRHRRVRLPDSFFTTTALRDQALEAANSRRSSSRLQYAFGQRLPEQVFHTQEFELFGGVSNDAADLAPGNSTRRLEEIVAERQGDSVAVWGGRVVPRSALTALSHGPIKKSSMGGASSLPVVPATFASAVSTDDPLLKASPTNKPSTQAHKQSVTDTMDVD